MRDTFLTGQFIEIDSSSPMDDVMQLCQRSLSDTRPGAANLDPTDWENKQYSLLYLIYIEKRFDGIGSKYILYKEGDDVLAGAGYCRAQFDPNIVHTQVRSYAIPGRNTNVAQSYFTTIAIENCKKQGLKGGIICFNEYNLRYQQKIYRTNRPENYPNYFQTPDGRHWAREGSEIWPGTIFHAPILLYNTKQWITYYLWDESYEPQLLQNLEAVRYV